MIYRYLFNFNNIYAIQRNTLFAVKVITREGCNYYPNNDVLSAAIIRLNLSSPILCTYDGSWEEPSRVFALHPHPM
jgi:hypothetical protein